MAEKDSIAVTAGGLEGLFRKPKTSFVSHSLYPTLKTNKNLWLALCHSHKIIGNCVHALYCLNSSPWPRPLQANKQGEEVVVVTSRPSDMIYIQSCSSCKFKVKSKSAKCIIGE